MVPCELKRREAALREEFSYSFRRNGLPAPSLAVDPDRSAIEDSRLGFLHDFWFNEPKPQGAPHMRAIDPIRLRPALGIVMLLETLDGGEDFRYRVYGSEIAARFGRDLTGGRTSEIDTSVVIPQFFSATYRFVVDARRPLLTDHTPPMHVSVMSWRRLILPFCDDDGAISRLLVGNLPGEYRFVENEIGAARGLRA